MSDVPEQQPDAAGDESTARSEAEVGAERQDGEGETPEAPDGAAAGSESGGGDHGGPASSAGGGGGDAGEDVALGPDFEAAIDTTIALVAQMAGSLLQRVSEQDRPAVERNLRIVAGQVVATQFATPEERARAAATYRMAADSLADYSLAAGVEAETETMRFVQVTFTNLAEIGLKTLIAAAV